MQRLFRKSTYLITFYSEFSSSPAYFTASKRYPMEELINILQAFHPLTSRFKTYLIKNATSFTIPRKQFLLQPGQTSPSLCYIQKGLLRRYHMSSKKELNSRFMKDGDLLLSTSAQEKSAYHFQAIELSRVILLPDNERIPILYRHFPELNIIALKVMDIELQNSDQISTILRHKKAKERYEALAELDLGLLSRIPSRYLASYLNISEGTISRIRGGKY